ncbi:TM2 domain-containing protein 3 isoform X2 [Dunckerocampus dactyliophorus]|uniref:TM2 domain-containing protein 3 isoform X2 n=1 Tax=Dunckerocampus dactyliophorus TaxID=161453 RepID=UPI002406E2E5|nr:TM2 domain-containing protein 3 isoform X2 [Dunckerocampus dactyliophorus]
MACQRWTPDRGRCLKTYAVVLLLCTDIVLQCVNGYLSSPHVDQEPPYTRDAQHGPVITSPVVPAAASVSPTDDESYASKCPSGGSCSRLPADCMHCNYQHNCTYGKPASFTCKAKNGVHCVGESGQQQNNFSLSIICQFCWQLDPSQYRCSNSTTCMTVACPRQRYNATCDVLDHVHCLGKRRFQKRLFCNWTGGYKWSTALALSAPIPSATSQEVFSSSPCPHKRRIDPSHSRRLLVRVCRWSGAPPARTCNYALVGFTPIASTSGRVHFHFFPSTLR